MEPSKPAVGQSNRPLLVGVIAVLSSGLLIASLPSNQPIQLFAEAKSETTDPLHPLEIFRVGPESQTLNDAFTQAGVEYFPEDRVTAFPDPSLGLGSLITVSRALPVPVTDGKKKLTLRTWQTTLKALLEEKKIDLGEEDRITPALATPLSSNLQVVITRVARTIVSKFETIAFKTIEIEDPNVYRGEVKVTQQGANGQRQIDHLLIREDGELLSDTIVADKVLKAAVDKKISKGSKLKLGSRFGPGSMTYYVNKYGTKVATDKFRRGAKLLVTNLNNGKKIEVVNDGCICGDSSTLIDLNPVYFQQLGVALSTGRAYNIVIEEVLN